MIQNRVIQNIIRNAKAQMQFEKIKKANEQELALKEMNKPKLVAPKFSLAEVRFWETYEQ